MRVSLEVRGSCAVGGVTGTDVSRFGDDVVCILHGSDVNDVSRVCACSEAAADDGVGASMLCGVVGGVCMYVCMHVCMYV